MRRCRPQILARLPVSEVYGHREMTGERSSDSERRDLKRLLPRDPWQVLIGPLIVLIVGAGITAVMSGGKPEPERKRPVLDALPPVVQNATFVKEVVQIGSGQTAVGHLDASKPRVEVRVHNTGTRRAVLTSARFTITDYARIVPCGLGAGLVVSARYDVVLAVDPRPGQAIEVPINQQLGPDEADRFVFRVGVGDALEKVLNEVLVYELRVTVAHDNDPRPVDVGRVIVAVPGAPEAESLRFFNVPGTTKCSEVPSSAARRAVAFKGTRSPEVDQFFADIRSRL